MHLTKVYRHMGRKTVPAGSISQEMTARHGSAIGPTKRIRYKFFKKSCVPKSDKMQVANMLVLSRELFGSGAWPILSIAKERRREKERERDRESEQAREKERRRERDRTRSREREIYI